MASSSSTFTFTSLQRRELFCRFFSSSINPLNKSLYSSSHTFPFPSSRNTLPPKSSIFLYPVKKNNQSFSFSCLDNHDSSSETINFRNIQKTLGSGCHFSGFNERVVRSFVRGKGGDLAVDEEIVKNLVNYGEKSEYGSGVSLSGFNEERVMMNFAKRKGGNLAVDEEIEKTLVSYGEKSEKDFRVSSSRWSAKRGEKNVEILPLNNVVVNGNVQRQSTKDNNPNNNNNSQSVSRFRGAWRRSGCKSFIFRDDDSKCKSKNEIKINKKGNVTKKDKVGSPEFQLRVVLDMCSKKGDVMGAISLYDVAVKKGVRIGQYHYTVLLYLCSSAAMGFIRPAKSGSTSRKRNSAPFRTVDEPNEEDEHDSDDDGDGDGDDMKDCPQKPEVVEIRVSDDVKKYALEKGFKIYESMCSDKVQMNEATLTAIARMAMAMGEGDMAFEMVKKMKEIGISPKLRSYDPALSTFSSKGDVDKAFDVEKHMLENGVQPEEPELEALLRVSVESGKAEKVYYLLHKLRTNVRSISPSTAYLIEKWFKSKEASKVGKRKYVPKMIAQTMENLGGGWHGKGWLGIGKWNVTRTFIRSDGLCKCCGEKLALIDLDPEETKMFAKSVASIALKREKNLSFQKFHRWLGYYGPFEAVVDAANIGLYTQRKFKPSKVNLIVNGIRHMFPSRKWPLIILHNRRLTGSTMEQPVNLALVDRWRNADALYATPTGSNDDWYWLYAAIKFKCLLVTNDEMRDHTFQLLGTDFFPKWKERHQVRFSFSEAGPVFHMPPPCSVVIQESEKGHWHIPIATESQSEEDRIWLCITRMNSHNHTASANSGEDSKEDLKDDKECGTSNLHPQLQVQARNKPKFEEFSLKAHRHLREKPGESELSKSNHRPIRTLKAAENLGGCVIDFQI